MHSARTRRRSPTSRTASPPATRSICAWKSRRAIQEDLNLPQLTASFVEVTAENRFDALTQGEADLLCEATTATLSRREKMDFSIYTFVSGASLVIQPGGPTSVETLGGRKIGVLGGTTTQEALVGTLRDAAIDAEVVVVKTHDEGFDLLKKGNISAYFGDRTILEDRLRSTPDFSDLLLADNYLTIEPYALAMPIDHDFRLAVDRALSHLFRTGGDGQGVPQIVRRKGEAFGPDQDAVARLRPARLDDCCKFPRARSRLAPAPGASSVWIEARMLQIRFADRIFVAEPASTSAENALRDGAGMQSDDPIIRPVREADYAQWLPLWRGYQEFYRARIPDEATRAAWQRFFEEREPVYCLVAERDGKLVGLAHYLFHRSTWLVGPACYLNDLFVDPSGRRSGVARKLIEAVYDAADKAGAAQGLLADP